MHVCAWYIYIYTTWSQVTLPFCTCRKEHESFSEREKKAYEQLVKVVIQDFLPFVKQVFGNLYRHQPVEQIALSTTYSLRYRTAKSSSSSQASTSGLSSAKLAVDLRMDLDVAEIGEMLRPGAASVFDELEHRRQQQSMASLGVKVQDVSSARQTGESVVDHDKLSPGSRLQQDGEDVKSTNQDSVMLSETEESTGPQETVKIY